MNLGLDPVYIFAEGHIISRPEQAGWRCVAPQSHHTQDFPQVLLNVTLTARRAEEELEVHKTYQMSEMKSHTVCAPDSRNDQTNNCLMDNKMVKNPITLKEGPEPHLQN